MNNFIGTMQGRLLPKYKGQYQAHPVGYWQDEFIIAGGLGLNCIEFILDYEDAALNPLMNDSGIQEIKLISRTSGVNVKTICADYFMIAPLHSKNGLEAKKSQQIMTTLIQNAAKLGVSDIVLPCVDNSSLNGEDKIKCFTKRLKPIIKIAEKLKINLSLETDLAPKDFVKLIERIQSKIIKVNYDIGNSASLGFNPIEELDAYGPLISDIHIKDRLLNGGPVLLGEGSADFEVFFNKLKEFNYKGPFIMQAFRDEGGLDIFKQQFEWVTPFLKNI
jgi:L-ribulose-5-phosphate 3-epimerase